MAESILNLTTKKTFRTITIDGQILKLLDLADLSMVDQYQFRKKAEKIQASRNAAELTEEQLKELEAAINAVITAGVPEIGPFLPQLTDLQKLAVMNSFLATTAPTKQTKPDAENSSTVPAAFADSSAEVSDISSELISSPSMT